MTVVKQIEKLFCKWWGYADAKTFMEGNSIKPININQYFDLFNLLSIHGTQLHESEVQDSKMKGYFLEHEDVYIYLSTEKDSYKVALRHYKVDYKLCNALKQRRLKHKHPESLFYMPSSNKLQ